MKKIFISILLIFLNSCGSIGDDGLINYDKNNFFSIKIPNNWDIKEKKDLPIPPNGDIELAVVSKTEKDGFSNNLLILSEDLKNNTSLNEYFKSNLKNIKNDLFEFNKIEEKEFNFTDGKKSKIIVFDARYDNKTPKLKFLQTVNFCEKDNKIFFLTISIPKDTKDIDKYKYILSNFNCKK